VSIPFKHFPQTTFKLVCDIWDMDGLAFIQVLARIFANGCVISCSEGISYATAAPL